ncbi:type VII secretion protein EccB [Streptomyces sp. NPDC088354]|uniref:type VII secretion protein EccB n=1 Tax=Streptomyces sp. NPDC088354 TaxID=3365856 RepID=UPI0037F3FF55
MQSKRDQVQAHVFTMGRITSGMLLADPDAPESPLGRTTRGAGIGLVIGAAIAAGAVVFGLVSPGASSTWRSGETLIVNKDTGARYLYLGGRLRPVRNYASALLIGGADLKTTAVKTPSLRDTPVGAAVGITGAPDAVPAPGDLETGAWTVCSRIAETPVANSAASDGRHAMTTLAVGVPLTGKGLHTDSAVLVSGPDGKQYLVWQGSRLLVDTKSAALASLGYSSVAPRPVSAAFLNSLVAGAELTPPKVPGLGTAGPSFGDKVTRIGQVFDVIVPGSDTAASGSAPAGDQSSANHQYFLLRQEGLAPVTATTVALLLGDPEIRSKAYAGASPTALSIGPEILKGHQAPNTTGRDPSTGGLPESPPQASRVPDGWSLCAQVEPGATGVRVSSRLVQEGSLSPAAPAAGEHLARACQPVDAVVVRPGHGALVRVLGAGGGTFGTTTYLVGDDGAKYRVPSASELNALGYGEGDARALPSPLLTMLPTGPDLNREVATGARPATPIAACSAGMSP